MEPAGRSGGHKDVAKRVSWAAMAEEGEDEGAGDLDVVGYGMAFKPSPSVNQDLLWMAMVCTVPFIEKAGLSDGLKEQCISSSCSAEAAGGEG